MANILEFPARFRALADFLDQVLCVEFKKHARLFNYVENRYYDMRVTLYHLRKFTELNADHFSHFKLDQFVADFKLLKLQSELLVQIEPTNSLINRVLNDRIRVRDYYVELAIEKRRTSDCYLLNKYPNRIVWYDDEFYPEEHEKIDRMRRNKYIKERILDV